MANPACQHANSYLSWSSLWNVPLDNFEISPGLGTYVYRRFGSGPALPLMLLQHFTGTLDNWDSAVTDPLAQRGEVILFESAGLGRSSGKVPETVAGMAQRALAFLDGLGLDTCDVLGFSLGGMVAQQMRSIVPQSSEELSSSERSARR